ncbi:MAG: 5'-3' exonuclease H3TH domain-containing protein, partial [Rhizobiaceae bacterium]
MKKGDHLFLVDGSGYIFRAYHALPPLNRKSDGLPTSAVLGFCNMVWKLMQDARNTQVGVVPSHFAVIFDYSSKTFRNELYAEYKANRSAPPEDLIPQFGLIREATRAFDLPCIEMEGFEADDLIATYARLAREAGADTTIISSDKDLMQLVGASVGMYDPMKDRQIGIPEVVEKWGVPPEKMIDLQALVGDSVDNVPGVPGIGPKTAAQLLEQFGDLDTLLARAGEIKQQKRRQSIIDNAEKARISRDLVTLKTDVAVTEGLDELVLQPPNGPKLIGFLKAMEFTTLVRRVAEATAADAAAIEPAAVAVAFGEDAHGPDMGSTGPAREQNATPPDAVLMATLGKTGENPVYGTGLPPGALATRRAEIAGSAQIDPAAFTAIRDLQTLQAWVDEALAA